ncbi:MAG: PilZ domain-containing protein [Rhodopseudomonas palustris]|uniref:PilZ domain-containing protein n=1 Tax=Rhodopseudomonas palustris TaxID=1076 RepID=A0A933RTS3_RHOPL|nr:PilZ domain-containing protein [Rhodopseudomonas palustris]
MTERRGAPRHRVFKRGTIAFGGAGFDCTVRNMSATGARIDVDGLVSVPEDFLLVIETDKVTHRCRPVWSAAQRIGVAFKPTGEAARLARS